MENKIKLIANSLGVNRVKFNEPVAPYTALGVGGPAKLFLMAFTSKDLVEIVGMCRELKLPFIILGTGSKMMISDNGFDGVVIKNITRGTRIVSIKGKVTKLGLGVDYAFIEIESGLTVGGLVEYLDKQGLSSVEFIDIPGSLGGNLFFNRILQSKVESVKVLTAGNVIEEVKVEELRIGKHIVLSAILKVKAKL